MEFLKPDSRGQLVLPPEVARQLGNEPFDVQSISSRHLLLNRVPDETPVTMCGVLGEIALPDLLSFFNMFRRTGILTFELKGGRKTLFFQKGEVVSAASTFAHEDLGEILHALGKVESNVLQSARQVSAGKMPLGKVLVERGEVSAQDLWMAARSQVEAIIYHLFSFERGSFYYRPYAINQEKSVRLSMNTQNLIMEGLRRQDERALFMRRVVSLDHLPAGTDKAAGDLPPLESKFYQHARSGTLNTRDLFRKVGLQEFEGLRLLYGFLDRGLLTMQEVPDTAIEMDGDLGQILTVYNGVFKAIYAKVAPRHSGFAEEVRAFLGDLPQPFSFVLRDVVLCEDGQLDGTRIVANLAGLDAVDRKKLLADALGELVFMESMAASRELDASQAQPLVARVQEIVARVKRLIGRAEE